MALKAKLILAGKIAAVFLIVPFLLARLTVVVLNSAYPPHAPRAERQATPTPAGKRDNMQERLEEIEKESAIASESLMSVRAKTRATLILVGIYYVIATTAWIILWRRKRSRAQPQ